ncbi:MAG TPA: nicotinamide riboside transporter PnuC [Thermoanaerobaculia bacterium]|nr:nicotinamide riboside transporter PnuC [Thermoanaerobaculia bacterium]
MSLIELVAAAVTLISIWLATKENVWYWPTGVVSTLLYSWVYFQARLYAETGLQVVWLALIVYGRYEWLYGGKGHTELPVTKTPRNGWLLVLASGIVASALIIWIQLRFTNNPAPYVDSSIAAWSIVAQWMTAKKWIENWFFWIVINVVAVALYINRALWATAALYAGLFILGIVGYFKWRKSLAASA